MDSMTDPARGSVVGVDAHSDTHHAAVLDDCGRLLGRRTFPANAAEYRELLSWAKRFGPIGALDVESTGSYAAGLVRYLRANGHEVLEINRRGDGRLGHQASCRAPCRRRPAVPKHAARDAASRPSAQTHTRPPAARVVALAVRQRPGPCG